MRLLHWLIGIGLILDPNLQGPAGQEHGEWCDMSLLQIAGGGCDWRCTGGVMCVGKPSGVRLCGGRYGAYGCIANLYFV
jgi:hypothetical protein